MNTETHTTSYIAAARYFGFAALVALVAAGCADPPTNGTDSDVGFDTGGTDVADVADTDTADSGGRPDVSRDTDTGDIGPDSDSGPDATGCDTERVGEACGSNGCGALVCRGGVLLCEGDIPNACGTCGELGAVLGEECPLPFGAVGVMTCDEEAAAGASCQVGDGNLCGGVEDIEATPGTQCGDCSDGRWICNDDRESMRCLGARELDACGGCGLDGEAGDACGACSDGLLACIGSTMDCVGATPSNICGGCNEITGTVGEACTDACGSGVTACSDDGERLICDGDGTANLCGGCGDFTRGERPGTVCSDCGVWVCNGDTQTVCSNPRSFNVCGGCSVLEGLPGTDCGCGGTWECDGVGSVVCVGGDEPNDCGGCEDLTMLGFPAPGTTTGCGGCGTNQCVGRDEVACVDPGTNACESCLPEPTGFDLGGECGCGGAWMCLGGSPVCTDEFVNACGGCGFLSSPQPGTSCGTCGTYECDGTGNTVCVEQPQNACGGCGEVDTSAGLPGESCGECHVLTCTGPDSLVCSPDGANACGGCVALEAQPGFPCGTCGTYACSGDGASVFCDDPGLNECGGCGAITVPLGESCGHCDGNVWGCREDGSTGCLGVQTNVCGGCGPLPTGQEPNDPCDRCGTYTCDFRDPTRMTTMCIPGIEFACGACERPAHFPNHREGDSCTVCGEAGTLVCDGDVGQCSTEDAFNACGGCGELDGQPGQNCGICGVYSCSAADNVACIDPCL